MQTTARGLSKRGRLLAGGAAAVLAMLLWRPLARLVWQVLLAVVLAGTALPLAKLIERKLPRAPSAGVATTAIVVALLGLLALLVPLVVTQISLVITEAPRLLAWAEQTLSDMLQRPWAQALGLTGDAIGQWGEKIAAFLAQRLPGLIAMIGRGADTISRAFLSPILAYYFLRDREQFTYRLSLWIPLRYRRCVLAALKEMRREAGGYIRGQLLVALAVALLTALGLLFVGVPAWLVLGLLMGVCELIPYVGPYIGAVPIVLFALPKGLSSVLWALGVAIAVQQLEGCFLSPRLMAGATGLHPVYVLLLLTAGGLLAGLWGMVLALPVFVCLRGAARVFSVTRS